jgi:hypothetical protein
VSTVFRKLLILLKFMSGKIVINVADGEMMKNVADGDKIENYQKNVKNR